MKFNVEIDMGEFCDFDESFDEESFLGEIKDKIEDTIVDRILARLSNTIEHELIKKSDEIIKIEFFDIKNKVIELTTEKILRKRDLRELCTSDAKKQTIHRRDYRPMHQKKFWLLTSE